jgi:abortive infection bacteriophage resistance protein
VLSKYFSNLLEVDKKAIAKDSFDVNEYLLWKWLQSLSLLRNICAHYSYLYKRIYDVRPKMANSFDWDPLKNGELFAFFLVMKRLSDKPAWNKRIVEIINREANGHQFNLSDYGFPEDWTKYLL